VRHPRHHDSFYCHASILLVPLASRASSINHAPWNSIRINNLNFDSERAPVRLEATVKLP